QRNDAGHQHRGLDPVAVHSDFLAGVGTRPRWGAGPPVSIASLHETLTGRDRETTQEFFDAHAPATRTLQLDGADGARAAGHHEAAAVRGEHFAGRTRARYRRDAPEFDRSVAQIRHRAGEGIKGTHAACKHLGRLAPVDAALTLGDL